MTVVAVEVEPAAADDKDDAGAEEDDAGGACVDGAAVATGGGLVPPWTSRVNRRTLRRMKEYLSIKLAFCVCVGGDADRNTTAQRGLLLVQVRTTNLEFVGRSTKLLGLGIDWKTFEKSIGPGRQAFTLLLGSWSITGAELAEVPV